MFLYEDASKRHSFCLSILSEKFRHLIQINQLYNGNDSGTDGKCQNEERCQQERN